MDYEARRKEQNREAQRRYRERIKLASRNDSESSKTQGRSSPASSAFSPTQTTPSTRRCSEPTHQPAFPGGTEFHDPEGIQTTGPPCFGCGWLDYGGDGFDNALDAFRFGTIGSGGSNTTPESGYPAPMRLALPLSLTSNPSTHGRAGGSGGTALSHRGSLSCTNLPASPANGALAQPATKLCAKAERLVDELEKLYDFGVDIDLMEPDEALQDSLSTTRFLFRKAAKE